MKFDCLDKWLSAAKDYHIPVTIVIFVVGTVLQWYGHLGADYVAFVVAILGVIVGHSFSPAQKEGDPNAGSK